MKPFYALWALPEKSGPGYAEVIKKFPDKYDLRAGHVYYKGKKPWMKIATKKSLGRPVVTGSIVIEHDFNDLTKLGLTLELARLLEENNCSDFTEYPSRKSLVEITEKRFG